MNTSLPRFVTRLTVEQLRDALKLRTKLDRMKGLEDERKALLGHLAKLDRKIARLRGEEPAAPQPAKTNKTAKATPKQAPQRRPRRKMSAAARQKIAEAQRKRWAGIRAATSAPAAQ